MHRLTYSTERRMILGERQTEKKKWYYILCCSSIEHTGVCTAAYIGLSYKYILCAGADVLVVEFSHLMHMGMWMKFRRKQQHNNFIKYWMMALRCADVQLYRYHSVCEVIKQGFNAHQT